MSEEKKVLEMLAYEGQACEILKDVNFKTSKDVAKAIFQLSTYLSENNTQLQVDDFLRHHPEYRCLDVIGKFEEWKSKKK